MSMTHEQKTKLALATQEIERLQQEVTMWNEATETQRENNLSLAMEVKRLKEENARLQQSHDDWKQHAYDMSHDIGKLEGKLQDALNTIERIKERAEMALDETDKYGWTIGLTAVRKYAHEAIDRIQMEQSGGTEG